ncbi:hypothetical protein [Legionella parisiensis]|nr:hypothetical protein [Legionella parisiensis]
MKYFLFELRVIFIIVGLEQTCTILIHDETIIDIKINAPYNPPQP